MIQDSRDGSCLGRLYRDRRGYCVWGQSVSIGDKAYVAGIYEHPFRAAATKTMAQLHAEIAQGALADAGLSMNDVDADFCTGDAPGLGPLNMIEYLGLQNIRHMDSTETGGSRKDSSDPDCGPTWQGPNSWTSDGPCRLLSALPDSLPRCSVPMCAGLSLAECTHREDLWARCELSVGCPSGDTAIEGLDPGARRTVRTEPQDCEKMARLRHGARRGDGGRRVRTRPC